MSLERVVASVPIALLGWRQVLEHQSARSAFGKPLPVGMRWRWSTIFYGIDAIARVWYEAEVTAAFSLAL